MATETIKSKIEKLFKKAESAKEFGSLEEAATFMAKAQELLMKHNLEMGDINLSEDDENPCIYVKLDFGELHGWNKTQGSWLVELYAVVAKMNFCKVISHGHQHITMVGEEHNTDVVNYMCSNIIPKLKGLRLSRWKEYHGHEKKNAFMRAYYKGAVFGIYDKLREQQESDKAKHVGLTGIIKLTDAVVDEAIAEKFRNLKPRKSRQLKANQAMSRGIEDGKNLKVNKGISGRKAQSGPLKLGQ